MDGKLSGRNDFGHELIHLQGASTFTSNEAAHDFSLFKWLFGTYLVLVGGVEGNLGNFGIFLSQVLDGAAAQLNTLQQGCF